MESKVLAVCIIVGFLGLLAAALGFAAEAKRIKVSDVKVTTSGTCTYPRTPALALGSIAGLAIVIAQSIINIAAGCICCCKKHPLPSRPNWTIALVCFIASWCCSVVLLFSSAVMYERNVAGKVEIMDEAN